MYQFAQNYPQLMNQASEAGFNNEQLIRLHYAFDVALRMSDGIYRLQGVPLLNHLTSTASIVLAESADCELVIAALLHAAYALQHFDDNTRSKKLAGRRQDICRLFGTEIEAILWDYARMPWHRQNILDKYLADNDTFDFRARWLLTLRLANELDDNLDNAIAYSALEKTGMRSMISLETCRRLALAMDLDLIANQFEEIIATQLTPIKSIRWDRKQGYQLKHRLWEMGVYEKCKFKVRRFTGRIKRLLLHSDQPQ